MRLTLFLEVYEDLALVNGNRNEKEKRKNRKVESNPTNTMK